MQITQALVSVGGKASRLKAGGIPVPLSKAFMHIAGESLFYWCLFGLHGSGIRRLVIAADQTYLLWEAEKIIRKHPCAFEHVDYFRDEGNGVHGLPYEVRYLLDDTYLIECGHSVNKASHYTQLMNAKTESDVIFSAYRFHPSNPRQPVALAKGKVAALSPTSNWAIGHPIVADSAYARNLLGLRFTIQNIISHYAEKGLLAYVKNPMPPEYDVPEEMHAAHRTYQHHVAAFANTPI